ncbi:hypothetical protein EV183_005556 [Coemansia sp. RSA 2336]|nr:hypothetical protein EV183_005556 [Coemansia sp. RSA 2336]
MARLTDLPFELLLRLLLLSGNEELVTVCRWTYFCLGNQATPRLCYRFVRSKGRWQKARVLQHALSYRFLSIPLLDQIKANEEELLPADRKGKRKAAEGKVGEVKIPIRLFATDENYELPKMIKLKEGAVRRKRRKIENPNQERFDLVRQLLSMGVSTKGTRCSMGLVVAAKAGNMAMVRLLLKNGADAMAGGDNKALLMAVVYGHADVAKRLVKSGAQISSLALRYAVQKKRSDITAWLMKKGAVPDMATIKLLDSDRGDEKQAAGDHPLLTYIRKQTSTEAAKALPQGWSGSTFYRERKDSDRVALHALVVPTADIQQFMDAAAPPSSASASGRIKVAATGGGALKYQSELERQLNIELIIVKELHATARGLQLDSGAEAAKQMLICNIGTGISLVRVDEQGQVERVSGSGIGGATFWGLAKRLTQFRDFDTAIVAANKEGTLGKADTLVEDIYGRETSKAIGLPPDLVAGFLGKLDADCLSDADISAALLRMFVSNVGQLAVFQARLLKTAAVWFTGGFVQSKCAADNGAGGSAAEIAQTAIADAVLFWSGGSIQPLFPQHAALLGAMGAIHDAL